MMMIKMYLTNKIPSYFDIYKQRLVKYLAISKGILIVVFVARMLVSMVRVIKMNMLFASDIKREIERIIIRMDIWLIQYIFTIMVTFMSLSF